MRENKPLCTGKVHDVAKKSAPPKSTVAPLSHKTTKSLYKSVSMSESPSADRHHTDSPEDNVSEAGTYTIDNEQQVDLDKSAVLKARLDIDRLFGLEPMDSSELESCCPAPNDIDIGKMSLEELMKQVLSLCQLFVLQHCSLLFFQLLSIYQ